MAQIEMTVSAASSTQFNDYKAVGINSKFMIHLEPSTSYADLSDTKKRLIQTYWDKEQQRRHGKLHEGALLSSISYDQKGLTGQFVPYKYFLAQLCDPSLKSDLKIVPVSLSGISFIGDQLIIGKRASWVSQYPDKYELAPSGGIRPPGKDLEAVDMKVQLLDELVEETGIESSFVKSVKYFSLIHDQHDDSIEICGEIRLKPSSVILTSSNEYTQILTIPCDEIKGFIKAYAHEFVPLSLIILKLKKLID